MKIELSEFEINFLYNIIKGYKKDCGDKIICEYIITALLDKLSPMPLCSQCQKQAVLKQVHNYVCEDHISFGNGISGDIVDLLREIERKEFNAHASGYKSGQRRLKEIFENSVGKACSIGVDYLRKELFEKEGI